MKAEWMVQKAWRWMGENERMGWAVAVFEKRQRQFIVKVLEPFLIVKTVTLMERKPSDPEASAKHKKEAQMLMQLIGAVRMHTFIWEKVSKERQGN